MYYTARQKYQASKRLSKATLTLLPLILLTYSVNTQALSSLKATTSKAIQGTSPYLTFDGGKTKASDTKELLSITLTDGRKYTVDNNPSTQDDPIIMAKFGETVDDLVTPVNFKNADGIFLMTITKPDTNYWGDDDGDGEPYMDTDSSGILHRYTLDKYGNEYKREAVMDWCAGAPYKLMFSTDSGILSTKYGYPNMSKFTKAAVEYWVAPNQPFKICYAQPSLVLAGAANAGRFDGPADTWDPKKGFTQVSTTSYASNFPTTGFNNAFFDIDVGGTGQLTWPAVTVGGITATMTPTPTDKYKTRITLTGPVATDTQMASTTPGAFIKPNLPAEFHIKAFDKNNNVVLTYSFVIKQWFIFDKGKTASGSDYTWDEANNWCTSGGYVLPKIKDLTNAICVPKENAAPCTGGVGGTPSSNKDNWTRVNGAGLYSEWGMGLFTNSNIQIKQGTQWTSDPTPSSHFAVTTLGNFFDMAYNNTIDKRRLNRMCVTP